MHPAILKNHCYLWNIRKLNILILKTAAMNTDVLNSFEATTQELLKMLLPLSDKALNKVPFKNSWTAGQLGDHLYKSYNVIAILNGNVNDTERPPDQKLGEVRKLFLDFTIKMESPKEVLPTEDPVNKEELLHNLKKRIDQQREVIINKDLSKTCLDFCIPEYGPVHAPRVDRL